jgi:predicted transposase YdaD
VGLYPFASLAQTERPELVLREVAARIEEIPDRKLQADLSAMSYILAGLVLDKEQIRQIIRREIMRESVTYQDILAEGETRGEARGLQIGLQQEKSFVLKLLARKLGNISPQIQIQVSSLPIEQVESLGEALLDFTSVADLETWLSQLIE